MKIEIPKIGMTFSRALMPQIDSDKLDDYLSYLKEKNIEYTKQKLPTKELKATQMEFDTDKVCEIMQGPSGNKPIIVSSDGYILDGHHRWLADYNKNKDSNSKVIVVNLPILELMRISKYFNNVEHRPLVESIKSVVKKALKERMYK